MFSGSISANRITLGLQPNIRQALYNDARTEGVSLQEFLRGVLREWYARRQEMGRQ